MLNFIDKIFGFGKKEPVNKGHTVLPEKTPFEQAKEDGGITYANDNTGLNLSEAERQKLLSYSFQPRNFAKDGIKFAQDSLDIKTNYNDFCGMYGVANEVVYTFFAKQGFIGWQLAAMLAQHWLINNACTIPNEDAVRNGWELQFKKPKDNTLEIEAEINKKYDIRNKLIKFGRNRKIFGIGIAMPVYKENAKIDFEKPFNVDAIKDNMLVGINVIDPYWCFPEFSDTALSNPTKADFYSPSYYRIFENRVHISHLCIWKNDEPADLLKPTYYFGGIPLPQLLLERVYSEEAAANESLELLRTKRTYVEKVSDMKKVLMNLSSVKGNLLKLAKTRNNHGVWLTENDAQLLETSLGGLSEVLQTHCELVAAIAKMPLHKLFKIRPTGSLGGRNDEIQVDYEQELEDLQSAGMTNFLNHFYGIALKSDYALKESFKIEFNSPKAVDGVYENEAELKRVQSIDMLVSSGIITPLEARKCIADEKLLGLNISAESDELEQSEDPELEEALKEVENVKPDKVNGGK